MAFTETWTPAEKASGRRIIKKAEESGLLVLDAHCKACGQKEGLLYVHCKDFDYALYKLPRIISGETEITPEVRASLNKFFVRLCWRCNMIAQSRWINFQACEKYWQEIKAGKQYAAVHEHDFSILERDHGIIKPVYVKKK